MEMNSVSIDDGGGFYLRNPRCRGLIVILHGFLGSPQQMRSLAELLYKDGGYSVLVPRLPGHGTSAEELKTLTAEWLISSLTNVLIKNIGKFQDVIKNRGKERSAAPVVLLGYSMGGAIAIHLASRLTQVTHLVTLAAPIDTVHFGEHLVPFIERFLRNLWVHKTPCLGDYDRFPIHAVRIFSDTVRIAKESLPNVTCPALVVHALDDEVVPYPHSLYISMGLGNQIHERRAVPLRSGNHQIHRDPHTNAVASHILTFLK